MRLLKLKRKVLSVLVTMSMLLMLLVPLAGVASASGEIDALTVPVVTDTDHQTLGTIKVTVNAGSLEDGDVVLFKITSGYDFAIQTGTTKFYDTTDDATVDNAVYVPATISDDPNGLLHDQIDVTVLDQNDEVQIEALADQSLDYDFVFYIYMKDVNVAEGTSADNVVTFSGPTNTGFPKGTVTNATVSSEGMVELAVSGADTSNNDFTFDLRMQETIAGSLQIDDESLKLKLPAGYEWTTADDAELLLNALWGDDIYIAINVDEEELTIEFLGRTKTVSGTTYDYTNDTSEASAWNLDNILAFQVSDEDLVTAGAINAKISGATDTDITTAKVGTYGDFGATVSAKTTPDVFAGLDEQLIGDIVITEDLAQTLVEGRTVTLTLPANARFQQVFEDEDSPESLPDFDSDEGLQLDFISFTGTDSRTAKFEVTSESVNNAAIIDLEDVEVALDACVTGDLVITVGGSAGLDAEVVVAKILAPITAKLTGSLVPNVIIGLGGQAGGDVTITESAAEAMQDDGIVTLNLPTGVTLTQTPKIEVTAGDARISDIRRLTGDTGVQFTVNSQSTEPTTISVTGILLKLDRTVAEGDINIKVKGSAVVATSAFSDWINCDFASKFAVAKVVTPAPGDTKYVTVFTIGSMIYTVNGVENTMDVAPYINANDRALLPIRFAANATGVSDSNIFWNATEQSVILSGHYAARIVRMVIGSTTMWINGVPMEMDTVPVLVDPGRTMLPIRYVAQALGADIAWDAATQTITITQTVVVQ